MTTQNKVIVGRDNIVAITFSGVDLTLFTKVEAAFGADVRDSVADSADVIVVSATELNLKFGDTTETSGQFWRVTGFDAVNVNGVDLTSECLGNLDASPICS